MKKLRAINKILFVFAIFVIFFTTISSASAQTCYSTFNGNNSYYDSSATYAVNTTINPLSYQMSFPVNNKIKTGGITMFWRYSTDAVTTQRAINTIPGYIGFTKTGEGTYQGRGNLNFRATTRATYFLYYKFQTLRGDTLTGVWRLVIS